MKALIGTAIVTALLLILSTECMVSAHTVLNVIQK